MTLKIRTKKEQKISLKCFKVGVIAAIIYVLPICLSIDWLTDATADSVVSSAVALLLWAAFWLVTIHATPRRVLGWLWEEFEIEIEEERE